MALPKKSVGAGSGANTPGPVWHFTTPEPENYEVTVTTSGKGIVQHTPGNPYLAGQIATLRPVPSTGWTFTGWSGADKASLFKNGNGSWSLTMNGDKQVTAIFIGTKTFLPIIAKK